MTKIEIFGLPQETSLEELTTYVNTLDVPDLEIIMSTGRFEVYTSEKDPAKISIFESQILTKVTAISTPYVKTTFDVVTSKSTTWR